MVWGAIGGVLAGVATVGSYLSGRKSQKAADQNAEDYRKQQEDAKKSALKTIDFQLGTIGREVGLNAEELSRFGISQDLVSKVNAQIMIRRNLYRESGASPSDQNTYTISNSSGSYTYDPDSDDRGGDGPFGGPDTGFQGRSSPPSFAKFTGLSSLMISPLSFVVKTAVKKIKQLHSKSIAGRTSPATTGSGGNTPPGGRGPGGYGRTGTSRTGPGSGDHHGGRGDGPSGSGGGGGRGNPHR